MAGLRLRGRGAGAHAGVGACASSPSESTIASGGSRPRGCATTARRLGGGAGTQHSSGSIGGGEALRGRLRRAFSLGCGASALAARGAARARRCGLHGGNLGGSCGRRGRAANRLPARTPARPPAPIRPAAVPTRDARAGARAGGAVRGAARADGAPTRRRRIRVRAARRRGAAAAAPLICRAARDEARADPTLATLLFYELTRMRTGTNSCGRPSSSTAAGLVAVFGILLCHASRRHARALAPRRARRPRADHPNSRGRRARARRSSSSRRRTRPRPAPRAPALGAHLRLAAARGAHGAARRAAAAALCAVRARAVQPLLLLRRARPPAECAARLGARGPRGDVRVHGGRHRVLRRRLPPLLLARVRAPVVGALRRRHGPAA